MRIVGVVKSAKDAIRTTLYALTVLLVAVSWILALQFTSKHQQNVKAAAPLVVDLNGLVTDGYINDIKTGPDGTVYVAGEFNHLGSPTGNAAVADFNTGVVSSSFPKVNAIVYSSVLDGSGGWFIGGYFTKVGNQEINGIAHILSDGTVDPAFDLQFNPYEGISSMTIDNGLLYMGGYFTAVLGTNRSHLAAINLSDFSLTSWAPVADYDVLAISVLGSNVYIGGYFENINGSPRNYLASVTTSGVLNSWTIDCDSSVYTIASSGSTIYIGGDFTTVDSISRNHLAAITNSGSVTSWDPSPDNRVNSIVLDNSYAYVGGPFYQVGGLERNKLAQISLSTGTPTSWTSNPILYIGSGSSNVDVYSLSLKNSKLYVGGKFTYFANSDYTTYTNRKNFAVFDFAAGGELTPLDISANDGVYSLSVDTVNNKVIAGGKFSSFTSTVRNNVAAFNPTTNAILSWNPNVNGEVYGIHIDNGRVYLGGKFTEVGGTPINSLARVSSTTGVLDTSWTPNPVGEPFTFHQIGNQIFVGGSFSSIASTPTSGLAIFDSTTGLLQTWGPTIAGSVSTIVDDGTSLYIGGNSIGVDGTPRTCVAKLSISAGTLDSWNPIIGNSCDIKALALYNNSVFIGGSFDNINGDERYYIGAVNNTDGSTLPWNVPDTLNNYAMTMIVKDGILYVGMNTLISYGGKQTTLALYDATTGSYDSWNPQVLSNTVKTLSFDTTNLYVGGNIEFNGADEEYRHNLFQFIPAATPTPTVTNSPTAMPTLSPTPSPTATPTASPSISPTPIVTSTQSASPTVVSITTTSIPTNISNNGIKTPAVISIITPTQQVSEIPTPITTIFEDPIISPTEGKEKPVIIPTKTIEKTIEVRVKVVDTENRPVKDAVVTITSINQTATTGEDGIAVLRNITKNKYEITVEFNGKKQAKSLDITTTNVSAFDVLVKLEPKTTQSAAGSIIQQVGPLGGISLTMLVFVYLLNSFALLRVVLFGGFLLPFLISWLPRRKRASVLDLILSTPVPFVSITVFNAADKTIAAKIMSSYQGLFNIKLNAGNYIISLAKNRFYPREFNVEQQSEGFFEQNLEIEKNEEINLVNDMTVKVWNLKPEIIVFSLSLVFAVTNALLIRTIVSYALVGVILALLVMKNIFIKPVKVSE